MGKEAVQAGSLRPVEYLFAAQKNMDLDGPRRDEGRCLWQGNLGFPPSNQSSLD